jgi:hypothetical protein
MVNGFRASTTSSEKSAAAAEMSCQFSGNPVGNAAAMAGLHISAVFSRAYGF